MRVAGNGDAQQARCQYEFYTEEKGIQQCKIPAKQVHHIISEHDQLAEGMNPNDPFSLLAVGVLGIPLCDQHHTMGADAPLFAPDACVHPYMEQALIEYRQTGNNEVFKTKALEYFDEHGRVTNGDWASDVYYADKMMNLVHTYLVNHPEDHIPNVKPHKKMQEHHWYDVFFQGNDE